MGMAGQPRNCNEVTGILEIHKIIEVPDDALMLLLNAATTVDDSPLSEGWNTT